MKILHLIDSGGLYGAERMLLTLCQEQQASGLQPEILSCGEPGEPEKPLEREAIRLGIPVTPWRMKPGFNPSGMKPLWKHIQSSGYELLHSHGYKFNVLLAISRRRNRSLPIVTTVHGYVTGRLLSKRWLYEKLDRLSHARLDRVVWVNQRPANKLKPGHHVISNGLKPPSETGKVYTGPVTRLVIIGRLSPEKGHPAALGALRILQDLRPNEHFTLAVFGEGNLESELKALAKEMGLSEQVSFEGYSSDIASRLTDYHALVMPSLTEGLPLTLLEGIFSGRPVFLSKAGAMPEVLGGNDHFIMNETTAPALAKLIGDWNQLSQKEREVQLKQVSTRVLQNYTATKMHQKYLKLYQSLSGVSS